MHQCCTLMCLTPWFFLCKSKRPLQKGQVRKVRKIWHQSLVGTDSHKLLCDCSFSGVVGATQIEMWHLATSWFIFNVYHYNECLDFNWEHIWRRQRDLTGCQVSGCNRHGRTTTPSSILPNIECRPIDLIYPSQADLRSTSNTLKMVRWRRLRTDPYQDAVWPSNIQ